MKEIEYTITVYEWWMDAGWFDVIPSGEATNRSQCFTNVLNNALAKFSTPHFDLYGLWHHWRANELHQRSRPRHVSMYLASKRMAQQAQQSYFKPLHAHLPSLLNLPKPPFPAVPAAFIDAAVPVLEQVRPANASLRTACPGMGAMGQGTDWRSLF